MVRLGRRQPHPRAPSTSGNVGGAWCDGGMETFTLVPRGLFSLTASIRFLEGFTPAWYSSAPDGVLELAFPAERQPVADALADLKKLPGIGDFSAGLTVLRGANAPDAVPSAEPRLARAIALAYGLPARPRPGRSFRSGELAAIPDLGHAAAANPAGVRDRRDHRQARSRPDGLNWGQHVVASRVPPAVRQVLHHQNGTIRTAGTGPSGAATRPAGCHSTGEHLTG